MEKNNIWKKRRVEFASLTRQGMSMTCIAKMHGITKQAVSLVLKKATADGEIVFKNRKNKNDNPNYIVKVSRKYITKKCKECQKDFLATPSNKRKTCSEDCLQKNKHRMYNRGGEWSRMQFVSLTCCGCGKPFERSNYLMKMGEPKRKDNSRCYCSRDCYVVNNLRLRSKS